MLLAEDLPHLVAQLASPGLVDMVLVAEHERGIEKGIFRRHGDDRKRAEHRHVELADLQGLEIVLLASHLAAGEDLDLDCAFRSLLDQFAEARGGLQHVGRLIEGARDAQRHLLVLSLRIRADEKQRACRNGETACESSAIHDVLPDFDCSCWLGARCGHQHRSTSTPTQLHIASDTRSRPGYRASRPTASQRFSEGEWARGPSYK
jgi:hypothetical protein